jgi:hypothetical protein
MSPLVNDSVVEADKLSKERLSQKARNHVQKIQENLEELVTIKTNLKKFVVQNPKVFFV